nr:MAG TPA: SpoVG [Caudoviricetes sp.]
MAQTKNTNTKGKGKVKDYEVLPDFSADFMTENGATVELVLYENGGNNQDRVKLVIGEAFIIYCSVVVVNKNKKERYAFLSYPSFYSKKSEKYFNQAYCFEKNLIEGINESLTSYYFD